MDFCEFFELLRGGKAGAITFNFACIYVKRVGSKYEIRSIAYHSHSGY